MYPGGLLRGGIQTEAYSQAAILGGVLLNAVSQAQPGAVVRLKKAQCLYTLPPPLYPALLLAGDFSDQALGSWGWSLNHRNRAPGREERVLFHFFPLVLGLSEGKRWWAMGLGAWAGLGVGGVPRVTLLKLGLSEVEGGAGPSLTPSQAQHFLWSFRVYCENAPDFFP